MAPPPPELSASQSKGKERDFSISRRFNFFFGCAVGLFFFTILWLGQQGYSEPAKPPKGSIRLVTVLIEDNRMNPPDHLLAEVYIRCWDGSQPDEYWCDAKDLVR